MKALLTIAATALALLTGCRPSPPPEHRATAPDGAVGPPPAPTSVASPSATTTAAPLAPEPAAGFSAEDLTALSTELRNRRVFRHLILGSRPAVRERHTWILGDDGRTLTVACEHGDPGMIVSGRPEPSRWYLVAIAHYAAPNVAAGESWGPRYERDRLLVPPRLSPGHCADMGTVVELTCRASALPVLGPEAYVPVETRATTPLPWRPAARQGVKGLACEAKATEPGAHAFNFYTFPNDGQPRPMLFFGDAVGVERVIYSGHIEYADFRAIGPRADFDATLPSHLRDRP
ncbi:MAG: hypothetical protein R3B72_38030 [Polyangiaceae bacterium]